MASGFPLLRGRATGLYRGEEAPVQSLLNVAIHFGQSLTACPPQSQVMPRQCGIRERFIVDETQIGVAHDAHVIADSIIQNNLS